MQVSKNRNKVKLICVRTLVAGPNEQTDAYSFVGRSRGPVYGY